MAETDIELSYLPLLVSMDQQYTSIILSALCRNHQVKPFDTPEVALTLDSNQEFLVFGGRGLGLLCQTSTGRLWLGDGLNAKVYSVDIGPSCPLNSCTEG